MMDKKKRVFSMSAKKEEKKIVLKIVGGTWENASRDMRELSVVRELGADVIVMAKGEKTGVQELINGFRVYRMSTRPWGKYCPKSINRLVSVFTWAAQASQFNADVISGHDLIPLFIGWMSTHFQRRIPNTKLVYDSHEFTIYTGKKSKLHRKCIKYLERFLIKKTAFTIEVNHYIAEEIQKIHHLKHMPIVVRNIPEKWQVDMQTCQYMRQEIIKAFGLSKKNREHRESFFLLAYHGYIRPERGIEILIEVLSLNHNLYLFLLGDGENSYIKTLKSLAEKKGVGNRILFHNAVPQSELWKYLGATDVGMITIQAAWKSYYYMLPNKLFENIQAETPVICSDFPAVQKIVEQYKIGLTCNPQSPVAINQCIDTLRLNPEFYQACKKSLKVAKEVLCWENEKKVLYEAYQKVL